MVLLAKSPLVDKYDLSSLHSIICGAAPLGKKTEIEVKNRIGVKVVRQGEIFQLKSPLMRTMIILCFICNNFIISF